MSYSGSTEAADGPTTTMFDSDPNECRRLDWGDSVTAMSET